MSKKRFVKILTKFNSVDGKLANKAADFALYWANSYERAMENISRFAKDSAYNDVFHDDEFDKLSLEQKNIYLNKKVEENVKLYIENLIIPYGELAEKYNLMPSKIKRIYFPVSENITTYKLPQGMKKFTDKDEIVNFCGFFDTYILLIDTKTELADSILYEANKEDLHHFRYNDDCIILSKDSIQEALKRADNLTLCVHCYCT